MPRVSIITLTYNHERYLAECLESARAQTFEDWELILVDDGSKDSSWEIAQEFARKDRRIKAFHQENRGYYQLAATHNFALGKSNGDLVAILDGDDAWPQDKLATQVLVHEPDTVMSYGEFMVRTERGFRLGPTPPFRGSIDTTAFLRHLLLHRSYMINVTLMMSRRSLDAIGGFIQAGPRTEMPTGLELSRLPGKVAYVPQVLGYWRQHGQQHTRNSGSNLAEYNLMLSLKTLLELEPAQRQAVGLDAWELIEARRAMIADTYFAATRTALLNRDHQALPGLTRQLWYYGNPKRKAQALYARLAAPLGWTYEPILKWFEPATEQTGPEPAPQG